MALTEVALPAWLCPEPPRFFRGRRAVSIALRTGHLLAVGVLLGGAVFEVAPARVAPWALAAVATGAGLVLLELVTTAAWVVTGAGLSTLLKLALLAGMALAPRHGMLLLVLAVIVASVGAHMPSRFRHGPVVGRRRLPDAHPAA
jgi:hypothetical protein